MNIPTALSVRERDTLRHYATGKRVVEAGTLLGFSALWMERVAASVITVDRHEGYGSPTWGLCQANLARYGQGRLQAVRGEALDVLPTVAAEVAFVDLTGQEAVTLGALRALPASVKVAMVHDCDRVSCCGVSRAIRRSGWKPVGMVDTLVVLEAIR